MKKISLLGAGNVATHLGQALKVAGYEIIQVWSRSKSSAEVLANTLGSEPITDLSSLSNAADIYILSVVDDAMPELICHFPYQDKVLCHTAGSVSMEVLEGSSLSCGVFYPLQTFSKSKQVDFKSIPLFIEANNDKTQKILLELAQAISDKVSVASSEQRKYLHIAAVFACNFSNYMYSIAEKMLIENNLSFDAIRPLIMETAEKAQSFSPKNVQTGPAVRNDQQTMHAHLDLLADSPQLAQLYQQISKHIGEDLG